MTGDLFPYPEYRDSGLPWLGQVPAHWETRRAKYLYREVDERSVTGSEVLCSVSHKTGVTPRKANVTMFMAESTVGYKICRPDDLAINTLWAWMAALGTAKQVGVVSPAYGVYRPRPNSPLLPAFADKLLRIPQYKREYIARSTGVNASRLRLYPDQFLCIGILLPPTSEQEAIVQFLDAMERKVSRFVRNRRRLIEVLNEQKQVVITHAVTRGLNPNARLKPSGIDWLNDVPAHWPFARLKDVADVHTGITLGKNYGSVPTRPYPYLRVANVQVGRVDLRTVKEVAVPESEARGSMLQAGDVLMTEGGDIDKLGRGCVWNAEISNCIHQNHIFAVRCRATILPEFLVGLMGSRHGRAYFQLTAKQTTNLASTNSSTLRAFPFFLPPVVEQRTILAGIAEDTASIEHAVSDAQHEIDLIREYRARLIADVVTGTVDVRGLVAINGDITETAPESLDEGIDEEMQGEDESELVEEVEE